MKKYGDALEWLEERIGEYCSYCELPLPGRADVEHVKPKKHFPEGLIDWDNFLLACPYCNGTKSDNPGKAMKISDYYWPHLDNTFSVFEYPNGGVPQPSAALDPQSQSRAIATLELMGLNRNKLSQPKATKKDKRWKKREGAWVHAITIRGFYDESPAQVMTPFGKAALKAAVTGKGFFSVWMLAFQGVPEVQKLFVEWFEGTCETCWDDKMVPKPRE